MALLTKAPRGTQDFTADRTGKLQYIERTLLDYAQLFGFGEVRTPMFEHTELFVRSVGDTTDVVQKEMYTFEDKKGRSITLKPEGTAGAVRAALEHGLLNDVLPLKMSYVIPCFRYERAQAGRYRQFHQFGVELLGAQSCSADAEVIAMVDSALKLLGVQSIRLQINSIGCPDCRPKYQQALVEYFEGHKEELCGTCLERLEKNPLRLLDCKEEKCSKLAANAPVVLDYLCDDCDSHFEGLKTRLTAMGIAYNINPQIVRGLDYYTKTVFEFITDTIGAQGTVCGGGRYDGLVKVLGGADTPAVGFAMGLERLMMVMDAAGCPFPEEKVCDIYLTPMGEDAAVKALALCSALRIDGFKAETDLVGRSLKAQMKYANKINAKYTAVIGDTELAAGCANLKNMADGTQEEVRFDALSDVLAQKIAEEMYSNIADGDLGDFLKL